MDDFLYRGAAPFHNFPYAPFHNFPYASNFPDVNARFAITGPDSDTGSKKQEENKKRREQKRLSQLMYPDNRRRRLNDRLRAKLENRNSHDDEADKKLEGASTILSEQDLVSLFDSPDIKPKKKKRKKRRKKKKAALNSNGEKPVEVDVTPEAEATPTAAEGETMLNLEVKDLTQEEEDKLLSLGADELPIQRTEAALEDDDEKEGSCSGESVKECDNSCGESSTSSAERSTTELSTSAERSTGSAERSTSEQNDNEQPQHSRTDDTVSEDIAEPETEREPQPQTPEEHPLLDDPTSPLTQFLPDDVPWYDFDPHETIPDSPASLTPNAATTLNEVFECYDDFVNDDDGFTAVKRRERTRPSFPSKNSATQLRNKRKKPMQRRRKHRERRPKEVWRDTTPSRTTIEKPKALTRPSCPIRTIIRRKIKISTPPLEKSKPPEKIIPNPTTPTPQEMKADPAQRPISPPPGFESGGFIPITVPSKPFEQSQTPEAMYLRLPHNSIVALPNCAETMEACPDPAAMNLNLNLTYPMEFSQQPYVFWSQDYFYAAQAGYMTPSPEYQEQLIGDPTQQPYFPNPDQTQFATMSMEQIVQDPAQQLYIPTPDPAQFGQLEMEYQNQMIGDPTQQLFIPAPEQTQFAQPMEMEYNQDQFIGDPTQQLYIPAPDQTQFAQMNGDPTQQIYDSEPIESYIAVPDQTQFVPPMEMEYNQDQMIGDPTQHLYIPAPDQTQFHGPIEMDFTNSMPYQNPAYFPSPAPTLGHETFNLSTTS